MKIYLDTCCFGRLFDDMSQDRIYYESLAIMSVFKRKIKNDYILVGSDIILFEIEKVKESYRKEGMLKLYSYIDYTVYYSDIIKQISQEIQNNSYISPLDSLHIACAKYFNVDVFLTTDDKLIKRSNNLNIDLSMRVMNPVFYIMEVV